MESGTESGHVPPYAFRRDLIKSDIAEALEIEAGPLELAGRDGLRGLIPIALIDARAAEWTWLILFAASVLVLRRLRGRPGIGSVD